MRVKIILQEILNGVTQNILLGLIEIIIQKIIKDHGYQDIMNYLEKVVNIIMVMVVQKLKKDLGKRKIKMVI